MVAEDYSEVTELPGSGATREQLERLYHRYHKGRLLAEGRRVLEVACGAGMGLGYLEETSSFIVGSDYTHGLLGVARGQYGSRVPLLRLDAQYLPFANRFFDVVLLYEAIYYIPRPELFVREAARVLAPGGVLLVATANREWEEFAPSPHSCQYLSAGQLDALLRESGFTEVIVEAAFRTGGKSLRQRVTGLIRRAVVSLNLMPSTLKARERYKRLFYGRLEPIPPEVSVSLSDYVPAEEVDPSFPVTNYKVVYCSGTRMDDRGDEGRNL
ncbi:class I SAM-dependent methyltransferase [Candidatus Latescibacterota bacterium]